jgi:hypothetical protein
MSQHSCTVRRASRIQNKKVDGWKRARPQVLFHSSCVALECYVPVTCTLMSNTGGCIWNSVIWIHPPTLKVAGSNPPGGRRKKNIYCSELQYWVFISMKYSKIMSNMIEKVKLFFQNASQRFEPSSSTLPTHTSTTTPFIHMCLIQFQILYFPNKILF